MLDFLIKDGFVVDGSGAPMFKADVGILKGKIVRVEKNIQEEAKNLIEANNLIVSPGFIDIHTHDDYSILVNPYAENKIMQGVTTDVMGNCGKSPFPVRGAYVERLKKRVELRMGYVLEWNDFSSYIKVVASKKPAINLVPLTGHNGLRAGVIGYDDRKPTSRELSEMKELLEKTLEKGSFGMSTGLIYPPGLFSTIQELIELSKVIKKYNGIYASHIRGEANTLISAVREAIQIGEETGVSAPTLFATIEARSALQKLSLDIPVIADGGISSIANALKALVLGADAVMCGRYLAGCLECPGPIIEIEGKKYKPYRGMGSLTVQLERMLDRYSRITKMIPEGVEAFVPYQGSIIEVIHKFIGGLKIAMGYAGAKNIQELKNARVALISPNARKEISPHSVIKIDPKIFCEAIKKS